MNRNYGFGELAHALSLTRQADNVVLALAKLENGKALTAEDKDALSFAVEFLNEVHTGSRWLSEGELTITQESARTISSFVSATESLSTVQSITGLDFDRLLKSASEVIAGRAGQSEVKSLRVFFGSIVNHTLDEVDRSLAPTATLVAAV